MSNQIIRITELCGLIKLSPSTIHRQEKQGKFPLRRRLGANSVGWLLSEVEAWIKQRPIVTSASSKQGVLCE